MDAAWASDPFGKFDAMALDETFAELSGGGGKTFVGRRLMRCGGVGSALG
jgi:hypothetical protein